MLRDYFAGLALQGILANNKEMLRLGEIAGEFDDSMYGGIADAAYSLADEMLFMRKKKAANK